MQDTGEWGEVMFASASDKHARYLFDEIQSMIAEGHIGGFLVLD